MSIPKGVKHPEESWKFVKYLTSRDAQQIWARNGQSCPARIPIAMSEAFRQAGPPQNVQYYLEGIMSGRPEPAFPGASQVLAQLRAPLVNVWLGKEPLAAAVEKAKLNGQAMLDQYSINW